MEFMLKKLYTKVFINNILNYKVKERIYTPSYSFNIK